MAKVILGNHSSVQCLRLVGIDEDLSFYEGAGEGPDVARIRETLKKESMKR